ncbi:hypothetical protein FNPHOIGM_00017 [Dickeya phage DchS19]|uniref:Uncharacterized protein n=2 Tax=Ningirsuvirus TaxID=2732688 RepID=A0A9E7LUN5_9CAUD|nr:hypothetical protein HOU07_gp23 [Dickeya phage vB_DsoP_JA10]AXG66376.1 hypothetical protein JA10_023 [Dickeya phage vB_DsoP_JA10]URX37654.1 hypothetical protein FNPHOIGM_00017 [Dickeya phage DchS19]
MFKLVKALGRLVAKLYAREARLKVAEAKALKKLSVETEQAAVKLREKAEQFETKSGELVNEASRIAIQATAVGKFFE